MADNTQLNRGVGGDVIRTLDRTGAGLPKTEVVTLDLGGGDGRSEQISGFPFPLALDIPIDDDGNPVLALSLTSMEVFETLFHQLIAASKRG